MAESVCYGLDIGGTKIELVAYDAAMQERHRRRIDTPTRDYAEFLRTVAGLIEATDAELGSVCAAVGLGLPGVRDRISGRQLSSNVPALTGQQVVADLQARLQRPLHVGNDCHCFALSEANGGAAEGYPSMFGAILGTGAGGGYCVEGRLIAGGNGIAGEWGHWTAPATLLARYALPLLDCACGLRGCVERYVSGSGLALIHQHLDGVAIDAGAIVTRADAGDTIARQAIAIHRDLLGHSLASLVLALDPHVIVLGGGLSKCERLYDDLPAAVAAHLFAGVRVPPILPPKFGDAGGARGAALLARQHAVIS
ncbi:ROK family protein [Lysobacter tyrosinilyticus]